MDDAVDKWIKEDCFDEEMARKVIQTSLRQSSRNRNLEPITVEGEESEGMHSYRIV